MERILFITIVFFTLLCSCEKQETGYLDTFNAAYVPDSVVFKTALNPDDPDDAYRIKFGIPFQSQSVQKVQGTLPIRFSIHSIRCDNGEVSSLDQFKMGGQGEIELSFNHTVPAGRYVISLEISNEWHVKMLDSALTVILR